MPSYGPGDLDVLGRAFERALELLAMGERDQEATKTILMTGIVDAASKGERDEQKLAASGLSAIGLYDDDSMAAVMQAAPL